MSFTSDVRSVVAAHVDEITGDLERVRRDLARRKAEVLGLEITPHNGHRSTARRALDHVPGVSERAPQNARGPATGASPRCRSVTGAAYDAWGPSRTYVRSLGPIMLDRRSARDDPERAVESDCRACGGTRNAPPPPFPNFPSSASALVSRHSRMDVAGGSGALMGARCSGC